MTSLGHRIRELRLKKGLTQVELSKGISTPSMVSQVESNRARPSYKMLAQIANRLEVPLEQLISDVDLNLKFTSTQKMARAMVASKDYAAAIPLLHELLDAPHGAVSRFEVMFDLAEAYLNTGALEQSEKWFHEVKDLAVMRQDHYVMTRVLLRIGQISMERRQYQLALYQWQQALDELEKAGETDVILKESILYRLGQAHSKLGKVGDAVECYEQALQFCEGANNLSKLGKLYMELAKSHQRSGNLEQSGQYAERAAHVYEMLDQVAMKTMLDIECAIVYGQTGRQQEAIELLHSVIVKFQDMGKQTEVGEAFVELARIQYHLGDMDQAEENCQVARTMLPELHPYQAWVNRILGQIALANGHRDEAIRRFERAADCFKSMEQVDEWEQTMYDLSRLYQEDHKPEKVIVILDSLRNFTRKVLSDRGIVL